MFTIGYKKIKPLNLQKMSEQYAEKDASYQPFNLANLQYYNPIYSRFFEMTDANYNQISLNQPLQAVDLHTLYDSSSNIHVGDVFIKFSPLLDPLKFITGKYKVNDPQTVALPTLDSSSCIAKIGNINNCSYTDAFFSYLSCMLKEKHGFVHGVDFYGSSLAVQERFRFNLADDFEFVKNSDFFISGIGKYFSLDENAEILLSEYISHGGSRANREKLIIEMDTGKNNTIDLELDFDLDLELDFDTLSDPVDDFTMSNTKISDFTESNMQLHNDLLLDEELETDKSDFEYARESSTSSSRCLSGSSYSDSTINTESNQDSIWETESESSSKNGSECKSKFESKSELESESEYNMYCYLHNFPVQLIMQERCKGTLDNLIMRNLIKPEEMISALFQIVMILLVYNRVFDFTHNDLHTNNIMYSNTNIEHLYYKYNGVTYKVPTYGRIYKLIDFGRAIYKYDSKQFCSDSFAANGDAYSQYNCEPFFNEDKPRLEPNQSFDLCRLACSMYDFYLRDSDSDNDTIKLTAELDELIRLWCTDDNGQNVVYKKNGQERYPGFKLYKMIARTVHNHTPVAQLELPIFKQYICLNLDVDSKSLMDIDKYPKWQQNKGIKG